jgi:hypothetical protein
LHGVLLVSLNWNLNDMIVQKENASLWSTPVCGEAALCHHISVEEFVMNVEPEGIPAMPSVLFRGGSDTRNTEHSA